MLSVECRVASSAAVQEGRCCSGPPCASRCAAQRARPYRSPAFPPVHVSPNGDPHPARASTSIASYLKLNRFTVRSAPTSHARATRRSPGRCATCWAERAHSACGSPAPPPPRPSAPPYPPACPRPPLKCEVPRGGGSEAPAPARTAARPGPAAPPPRPPPLWNAGPPRDRGPPRAPPWRAAPSLPARRASSAPPPPPPPPPY